jgi:hypothetical protein
VRQVELVDVFEVGLQDVGLEFAQDGGHVLARRMARDGHAGHATPRRRRELASALRAHAAHRLSENETDGVDLAGQRGRHGFRRGHAAQLDE